MHLYISKMSCALASSNSNSYSKVNAKLKLFRGLFVSIKTSFQALPELEQATEKYEGYIAKIKCLLFLALNKAHKMHLPEGNSRKHLFV